MMDIVMQIVVVIMGLWFLLFNKSLALGAVEAQYKMTKKKHDVKKFEFAYIISGVAFVFFGLLMII